jgi:hypothetical protein
MSVFFKKVRGEVHDNLSSRVPMLTLVEEERFMLTLVNHDKLSSRGSMLNLVLLERSCKYDANLNSRGETHANPSSRESMLNQVVLER